MKIVRHIVSEMKDNIQRCIVCGEIIFDYRNVSYPTAQGRPWGFPAGELFIQGKNPTAYLSQLPAGETAEDCGAILKVNRE